MEENVDNEREIKKKNKYDEIQFAIFDAFFENSRNIDLSLESSLW